MSAPKSLEERCVYALHLFLALDEAMDGIGPDHTEPISIWRDKDAMRQRLGRALDDAIDTAYRLERAAQAMKSRAAATAAEGGR